MYPLLARFSLGQWALPWSWPLAVLLVVGGVALFWGARTGERSWVAVGALVVLGAAGLGWGLHGREYVSAPFFVPSWGALLALSAVALWVSTRRRALVRGLPLDRVEPVLAWAALGALGGARLVYGLEAGVPLTSLPALSSGGLSGVGAVWGGLVGVALAARRRQQDVLELLDAAAPSFAFAVAAVGMGCYLQGCDFGSPLGGGAPRLLQVLGTFPRWSADESALLGPGPAVVLHQEAAGLLSRGARLSVAVHPTQLYEALGGIGLLGFAAWWEARAPVRGSLGCAVFGAYAALVVLLVPWRADPEHGLASLSLWVALALTSAGGGVWLVRSARVVRAPSGAAQT